MVSSREIAALVGLTLLGLLLRLAYLDHEGIWLDEAFTLDMTKASVGELMSGKVIDPGNPPLYYVLLLWWEDVFGRSVESARAFSGVMGALCIPATWLLARAVGGHWVVRLAASLLVAASPPLVYLGREARVYALFTTVVTLAVAAIEVVVTEEKWGRRTPWGAWLGWIVLASSFCYLHYYGFFLLAVLCVYLFVRLRPWQSAYPIRGGAVVRLAVSYVVIAIAFIPWLPRFLEQIGYGAERGSDTWFLHVAALPLYSLAGTTLVWKQDGAALFGLLDAVALFAVYVPLLFIGFRWRWLPIGPTVLTVGVLAMLIFVAVVKTPMIQSRYLVVLFPCLMILLAAGWDAARVHWRLAARVSAVAVAGLMASSLVSMFAIHHKEEWRPVAKYVFDEAYGLPVYCYEDVARLSFEYYLPLPPVTPITARFSPDGEPWMKDGFLEQMQSNPDGCWFILYLSLPETMPEKQAIYGWLSDHFQIVDVYLAKDPQSFPMIRLFRLKPK